MKRLRWEAPADRPLPKHPIRDSAFIYALMAAVIISFGIATGGSVGRSLVIAALFYAAAMGWAVVRWRQKLRDQEGR